MRGTGAYERQWTGDPAFRKTCVFSERTPPHARADRVGSKGQTMSNFSHDERVKPFTPPSPHMPFRNLRLLSCPEAMECQKSSRGNKAT